MEPEINALLRLVVSSWLLPPLTRVAGAAGWRSPAAHLEHWCLCNNTRATTQVFGLSVLRGNATPGSQLLNLRYRSELQTASPIAAPTSPPAPAAPSNAAPAPPPPSGSAKGVAPPLAAGLHAARLHRTHGPLHRRRAWAAAPLLKATGLAHHPDASPPSSAAPSTPPATAPAAPHHHHDGAAPAPTACAAHSVPPLPAPAVALRSGVEGPGLSLAQRLLLCAGLVLVPYAWSRLSSALARACMGGGGGGGAWGRAAGEPEPVTWADLLAAEGESHDTHTAARGFERHSGDGAAEAGEQQQQRRRQQQRRGTSEDGAGSEVPAAAAAAPVQPGGVLGLAWRLAAAPRALLRALLAWLWPGWAAGGERPAAAHRRRRGRRRRDSGERRRSGSSAGHRPPPSQLPPQQQRHWAERALRAMQTAEAAYRAASLANLFVFLAGGHYRCAHTPRPAHHRSRSLAWS